MFDTQHNFEAFGQTLVPILEGLGIELGKPEVQGVHNIVRGE